MIMGLLTGEVLNDTGVQYTDTISHFTILQKREKKRELKD